jgi:hypothetical protein
MLSDNGSSLSGCVFIKNPVPGVAAFGLHPRQQTIRPPACEARCHGHVFMAMASHGAMPPADLFAPTGCRGVATGGERLSSAERNSWKNFPSSTSPRQGRRNGRFGTTRSGPFRYPSGAGYVLFVHAHGLRSGSLRVACAPPVATFLGPHPGPGPCHPADPSTEPLSDQPGTHGQCNFILTPTAGMGVRPPAHGGVGLECGRGCSWGRAIRAGFGIQAD